MNGQVMSIRAQAPSEDAPQKMGTVAQTIALLRFLADMRAPMGVNAIARELELPASSCFRILKQLAIEGFAQFDGATKCYSLGGGAAVLARRAVDPANIFSLIQPTLSQFVAENRTSLGFWRRMDHHRIVLAGFIESAQPLRVHMSVGQRLPMFIGAVGRAFAGELELSEQELVAAFSELRWQAPPPLEVYRQQVSEYKRVGYAIDCDQFSPGVTTVATVLNDASGNPAFGLSAINLSNQVDADQISAVGRALVALKAQIQEILCLQG